MPRLGVFALSNYFAFIYVPVYRRGCLVLALKFSCKKFSAAFQPSFFEQRGLFSVRGDRRERATKKLIAIRPRMLGG